MKPKPLLPLFLAAASAVMSFASRGEIRALRVIDGDTFVTTDQRHIRFIGVDTPEVGECYAQEATSQLEKLILGKKLTLETDANELDQFGRVLAYVFLPDGRLVNGELLSSGTGEYFHDELNVKYQGELIAAAQKGLESKAGRWSACAANKSEGCNIKGNLDKWDVRRFVIPSSRHYSATVVNLDHYDRWFCSEEEAVKAGFVKERL